MRQWMDTCGSSPHAHNAPRPVQQRRHSRVRGAHGTLSDDLQISGTSWSVDKACWAPIQHSPGQHLPPGARTAAGGDERCRDVSERYVGLGESESVTRNQGHSCHWPSWLEATSVAQVCPYSVRSKTHLENTSLHEDKRCLCCRTS